jgi:NAD(P)-dependent dehydrogenase (short-subunit alcohol dehydrogenase family)
MLSLKYSQGKIMEKKLSGKVALVTGSSRGLGKAIALELASAGASIAVNYLSRETDAESVVQDIRSQGGEAFSLKGDVGNSAAAANLISAVLHNFGKIDILVNNAGLSVVGASAELEETRWRTGMDVMLNGVFFCSQAAGREMIKKKSGKIINIASVNGIVAFPERACYCAAKGGVMALTKALGCEWARYNINVNAVAPGYIETDLVKNLAAQGTLDVKELASRTPAGRIATGSEIASCVSFLASDESRYIQGQTIVVDGGWTAFGYLQSWLEKNQS